MTTKTTTIRKLFADMVPMKVMRFLGICGIMKLPCIKVRKRMPQSEMEKRKHP
jgi:hypothetical protein